MSMLDGRGRLRGRVNLIDAAATAFVLLIIPLAFVAYRTLRVPDPIMRAVTPTSLSVDGPRQIRVTGEHFRPFLRAFVSKTGLVLSAVNLPDGLRANYLIQTPSAIELDLPPDLRTGTYDVYLFDEGREVARITQAFTLTPPPPPPKPVVTSPGTPVGPNAILDLDVRFSVDPDIVPAIKVGDADLNQPEVGSASSLAAVILSWQHATDPSGPRSLRLEGGPLATVAPSSLFDAVVRLGAVRRGDVWEYAGPQRLRISGGFAFATSTYMIAGSITALRAAPERAQKAPGR